jgi:hypothetical protein
MSPSAPSRVRSLQLRVLVARQHRFLLLRRQIRSGQGGFHVVGGDEGYAGVQLLLDPFVLEERCDRGVGFDVVHERRGQRTDEDGAGAFGRSYAIVFLFLLLSTLVLAPFGIRQLVRYQFASQAVMAQERRGGAALRRSSALVRGRWWHTAVVVAGINGAIAVTALTAALLLQIVVSGVPLWIFSGLVSLVYTLVVPLAALAVTLLYGDAVAEREETEANEPVPAG